MILTYLYILFSPHIIASESIKIIGILYDYVLIGTNIIGD